jgi:hypothetical protein
MEIIPVSIVFILVNRIKSDEPDHPLLFAGRQVDLVANDGEQAVLAGVLAHRANPLAQALEGLLRADVVHADDAVCFSEVLFGDGSVALLARCVPELEGHDFLVDGKQLHLKVHAYI